jgi:cation diffusion facilitator family transporter
VHTQDASTAWNPFPPVRTFDDTGHRREAIRAIAISAIGLALTGLAELAIALVGNSVGLLSDALHNLSDVSTSLVVFIGFRVSRRTATPGHPYGYERAEDLAGLGVALVVWASAVFAGYASIHKLLAHGHTSHLALGMLAAVIGIVGNRVVAWYKHRVGTAIQSATLIADARHSWLDALASAGALLGLAGAALGYGWADGVAGLIVTAFIVHVGWEVTSELVGHLMDGVDPEVITSAERAALGVGGVRHVHIRARWMGRSLLIEVEGFVPPDITVHDGEQVGSAVETAITRAVPEARAVLWYPRALPA